MLRLDFDKLDPQHMGRDHLKAYQNLNEIYTEIIDESEMYNSKVKENIEDIGSTITSIFNQIPNLEKYDIKLKQNTNYYYHYATSSYFWDKFHRNDDYELIVGDKVSGHYKLVYHVSTIAVGDKEDLDIIVNIQWNQPIKGKCGWEHGYWKRFQ